MSHDLGTIRRNAPLPETPDQLAGKGPQPELAAFLHKYSMDSVAASILPEGTPSAAEDKDGGGKGAGLPSSPTHR